MMFYPDGDDPRNHVPGEWLVPVLVALAAAGAACLMRLICAWF